MHAGMTSLAVLMKICPIGLNCWLLLDYPVTAAHALLMPSLMKPSCNYEDDRVMGKNTTF